MKMVRQVLKFDHTVDVIGLAMMTDEIEKVSTTQFFECRQTMLNKATLTDEGTQDQEELLFPFTFEIRKYIFF